MPSGRFSMHERAGAESGKSLNECIESLCSIQLRKQISTYPKYSKPRVPLQSLVKPVKKAAFEALFRRGQADTEEFPGELLSSGKWSDENIVHAVAFRLRTTQRRFHDADRLEELTGKLLQGTDGNFPCLRFLLCLADVKNYPHKRPDITKRRKAPTRDEIKKIAKRKRQLYAGDYPYDFYNHMYTIFPPWYGGRVDGDEPLMYPGRQNEVQQDSLHAKRYSNPDMSVYKNSMGLFGLQTEFFCHRGLTDSPYEIDSQTRLYGGLRHSRTFDLDIKLSYPKITGPIDMMASITRSMTSIDEGFVSPSESLGFSDVESEASPRKLEKECPLSIAPYVDYRTPNYDLNLWRECLSVKRSNHRTWETLGLPAGSTDGREYYVTEAGAKVFDEIWQHRANIISRLTTFLSQTPTSSPRWVEVSEAKLIKHCTLVTMGVASDTFQFNGLAQMLIPRKNVFFSGVDPEAVHSLLTQFSQWGTCYWRLVHFAALSVAPPKSIRPTISFFQLEAQQEDFEDRGAIFKAFTDAVRRYLHEFQHQILSVNLQSTTLQKLALQLRKAGGQIRYICQLCRCGEPDLPSPSAVGIKDFPTGIKLLSYLYEEAVHCPEPNHYLALLYLLRKSCLPYIQFVKDWVFRGNCWDIKGEFMLKVNPDYGGARQDRQRWLKYVEPINPEDPSSCVPSFLSSMANDIYACGKTVALLQFISPEHFLVIDGVDTPELEITFSKKKLQRVENGWKRHDIKMKLFESERTTHWIKKEEELKTEAHNVALKVRKAAKEEILKMQQAIEKERKERSQIKREEFERLKKQAAEEAERRRLAIRAEKQEDARREAQVHEKEVLKQAEENRILLEEKEKIISYYEELNVEAEKRIRKAAWIKRRKRLQTERMVFHDNDMSFWKQQMSLVQQHAPAAAVSDSKSPQASEGFVGFDQGLDTSTHEDVFQPVPQTSNPEPDLLLEFLDSTLSSQKAGEMDRIPKEESDTEKALRSIQSERFMPGVAEENFTKRQIAPGIHHVSEETSEKETGGMKIHRKSIPGKSVLDSNMPFGEANVSPMSQMLQPELMAIPASVSPVCGKNISDSNIGDLIGFGSPTKVSNTEDSKLSRKVVAGQHISATTIGNELTTQPRIRTVKNRRVSDSSMAAIMRENSQHEADTRTLKKIVPGQGVSKSSIADLLTSKDVEPSVELPAKTGKRDSVMEDILYGSPEGSNALPQHEKFSEDGQVLARTNDSPHPADSTVQTLMYGGRNDVGDLHGKKMVPGRNVSESCVGDLMKPTENAESLSSSEVDRLRKFALANRSHHGHHSQSTIQNLVFYDNSNPWDVKENLKLRSAALKKSILKPAVNQTKRHPSYSTLQLLMYPKEIEDSREKEEPVVPLEKTFHLQLPSILGYSNALESKIAPSHQHDVNEETVHPLDLIGDVTGKSLENEFEDDIASNDWRSDIDAVDMHALPVLLSQCIVQPIMQQVALANRCVINYFMVDLELMRHFEMLRHFCFMEDGEFGQILSIQLFEKMHSGCRPIDLLNPVVVGSLITQAVQGSAQRNSQHAKKLTFSVRQLPPAFSTNDPSSLDCFTLKYDPGWPCNIVITESNQQKYGQVFAFLMKLKHVMWTLHDAVSKLSSMASYSRLSKFELRQLHLYRHEMQNFVKVMQGYVSTQVVHVCWHEFQDSLKSAKCLEDLHSVHVEYLRKCIYRCLLTKNTSVIMNVITDVFKSILRFSTQLSSKYVAFSKLEHTYENFQKYSKFLFKVVSKLVECGYQPHLEDFLLRLNYNGFYEQ